MYVCMGVCMYALSWLTPIQGDNRVIYRSIDGIHQG